MTGNDGPSAILQDAVGEHPAAPPAWSAQLARPASFSQSRAQKTKFGKNSCDQLFLSVFLNLMAFFAVLVAISEFEVQKTSAVIGSLRGVFGSNALTPVQDPDEFRGQSGPFQSKSAQDLAAFISRMAELRRVEAIFEADSIKFSMQPNYLFDEPRPILRDDQKVLLVRLGNLLNSKASNWRIAINASSPLIGATGSGLARQDLLLLTERLDAVAAFLSAQGVPGGKIELGVVKSDEHRFEFNAILADSG